MKHKITLVPYGGLANRLRAIESLMQLKNDTNACAEVLWFKNKELNCSFKKIFQPIEAPNLRIKEASPNDFFISSNPCKKNLYFPLFLRRLSYNAYIKDIRPKYASFNFKKWVLANKKVLIASCYTFYTDEGSQNYDVFVPTLALQDRINEQSAFFSKNTIGVHIRRTDNLISTKESPTTLFIEKMKDEIECNNQTNFYVASDSIEEKTKLYKIFGKRILTQWEETSRKTQNGIQDAVVELYTLSKTTKILGSHYSSFSETAAVIGKIPYQKIIRNSH